MDALEVRPAGAADAAACAAIVAALPDQFTPDAPATVREDLAAHGGTATCDGADVIALAVVARRGVGTAEWQIAQGQLAVRSAARIPGPGRPAGRPGG